MKSYEKDVASNDKVEMIHISRDQDEGAALDWAKKEKFPWPTLHKKDADRNKVLFEHYQNAVPTYVLVDREGKMIAKGKSAIWGQLAELK